MSMKGFLGDEQGQAIVEYVLALSIAIAIVVILARGFRTTLIGVWNALGRDVAAACPGCPPDQGLGIRK